MPHYILALDQGTTGSTALIVDASQSFRVIGRHNVEFKQHYPKPGWVEHDLDEIWASVAESVNGAVAAAKTSDTQFDTGKIAGIGITNQRETLCVFDRNTGAPARRAIVWQCRRGTDYCAELIARGHLPEVRRKTGLLLDPYFSGSKIRWIMDHEADTARRVRTGKLLLSTIDTFLLFKLTNGKSFATEASNASRTLLFDIDKGRFDSELLEIFGLSNADPLPEVRNSVGQFGVTQGLGFLPDGIPISGIVGDQQAALAGQCCFRPGEAKCTYGTGAFLLAQLGSQSLRSQAGLLTTVAWQIDGNISYAFEGAAFVAGAAVQFLRDQLGLISKASEVEMLASHVIAAPEIYFVPSLSGLGAPHWEPRARGSIFGMTRGTSREQLIRAALESIAFQVDELITTMNADAKAPIQLLRVDGGAAANNLLMQMQADLSSVTVDRPTNLESTALGAAMFAALGIGAFKNLDELSMIREADTIFEQRPNFDTTKVKAGWQRAIAATKVFSQI